MPVTEKYNILYNRNSDNEMRKSAYFGSYIHNKTVLLHTLYCTISNFHSRSSAAVKRQRKQTNKTTRWLTTRKTYFKKTIIAVVLQTEGMQ